MEKRLDGDKTMFKFFSRLIDDEKGLEPVEYALLMGFASFIMIAGAYAMSTILFKKFSDEADAINIVVVPDLEP